LGVSAQNFTQLGRRADFWHPFIWSRVTGLMRFCDGSNRGTANMKPSCDEIWIDSYEPETKQQSSQQKILNSPRPKKETGEEQSQEHAHRFL
jgi:hypothetical protein